MTPTPPPPTIDWDALRAAAAEVAHRAYARYSQFRVGAAGLVDDGRVVVGCNVENASYGLTLCAECGLVSALHAGGGGRLVAVAVTDPDGHDLSCCGRCRQLLFEAGGPALVVNERPMTEWLPGAFGPDDLDEADAAPSAGAPAGGGSA
jgi:cytidine deaminase